MVSFQTCLRSCHSAANCRLFPTVPIFTKLPPKNCRQLQPLIQTKQHTQKKKNSAEHGHHGCPSSISNGKEKTFLHPDSSPYFPFLIWSCCCIQQSMVSMEATKKNTFSSIFVCGIIGLHTAAVTVTVLHSWITHPIRTNNFPFANLFFWRQTDNIQRPHKPGKQRE